MTMRTRDRPELLSFARRLARLRAQAGLSQRELARESGVGCIRIAGYEVAANCPSADALAKLADALGVTMDKLWRGKETP
jgi:transcriptional regulator with XRE-family HTH domain